MILPNLPVARVLWKPYPNMNDGLPHGYMPVVHIIPVIVKTLLLNIYLTLQKWQELNLY